MGPLDLPCCIYPPTTNLPIGHYVITVIPCTILSRSWNFNFSVLKPLNMLIGYNISMFHQFATFNFIDKYMKEVVEDDHSVAKNLENEL